MKSRYNTVACAQCHDHRYDPISQVDYFRLRAIFDPALDWRKWQNPSQRTASLYSATDKTKAAEIEKRRKDPSHDPAMSAATYIAELLSGGADQNDLRLRAALEVAADLGIRAIAIDPAQRTLRIEGFNEQAALATAFLQGAPVEQFKAALTRVQTLNRMATDQAKIVAKQGQPAGKQRAASPPPPAVASAQVPYKRRRRD
jgi:hypothetical protein